MGEKIIHIEELLQMYENVINAVEMLSRDVPHLADVQKEIEGNISEGSIVSKKINTQNKHFEEVSAKATAQMETLLDEIKSEIQNEEQIKTDVERLLKKFDNINKVTIELEKRLGDISEAMSALEFKVGTISKQKRYDMDIDYVEKGSGRYFYSKYHNIIDGPIIVVKDNWTGDYCMVINELIEENGKSYICGVTYKNGKEYNSNAKFAADVKNFSMYNGPSASTISKTFG